MNLRALITAVAVSALAACGADTATTAATGAGIKKREIEEGKKTMERMQDQIGQSLDQARERTEKEAEK